MPHIANTPESLLPRTDSLNPATTCRGTTNNGRPCRRPLNNSSDESPVKLAKKDPSALFCWQHKDQAEIIAQEAAAAAAAAQNPSAFQMKPRSSIDTLMERLGVMDLNGGDASADAKKRRHYKQRKKQKKRTICCCFEVIEEEDLPPPPRPVSQSQSQPQSQRPQMAQVSRPTRPDPARQRDPIMKWIPPALSDQTTSVLAGELEKPISDADEPGYIYMFWMTPTENNGNETARSGPPTRDIASSLMPPSSGRHQNPRRISEALQTARDLNTLASGPSGNNPGTLRLKIGRTSNVQRRLNEWTRQCSHDLTLIRYYPYTPSTPSPSPSPARHGPANRHSSPGLQAGRKVPHVHRVERLIHLELADIKARDLGKCADCGKEHREWFEVPADKASLKRVDDCIRRWVEWAEKH